jgi:multiple sugar transport system substrate-binding protein
MTWNHPRGLSPLLAASARWREKMGIDIEWDARSLQDFESYPLEELARRYDLIVIDHPHVGQVCETGCLVPLDTLIESDELAAIAAGSVGGSYESYLWEGRQWALPIDAAAQVQAWVPGRIDGPRLRADDLPDLVAKGQAVVPLRSPHALMTLFTLCGLSGVQLDTTAPELFPAAARIAYDRLAQLVAASDVSAWAMDPIAVLEEMATSRSGIAVAPFVYGYASYSREDGGDKLVRFANLPTFGGDPRGSALGGTGLAVSRFGEDPAGAARFAAWYAGGPLQRDLVGPAGGQPAHHLAWSDADVNRDAADFYAATRRTLDLAWLRPRHNGYMAFQQAASGCLESALQCGESSEQALTALNRLYGDSR